MNAVTIIGGADDPTTIYIFPSVDWKSLLFCLLLLIVIDLTALLIKKIEEDKKITLRSSSLCALCEELGINARYIASRNGTQMRLSASFRTLSTARESPSLAPDNAGFSAFKIGQSW